MNFGSGMYSGYNSYQPQYSFVQPQLPQQQIVKVNGENGAKAIRLAPNSSLLALDETAPILWSISTDGAGYATQMPYDISVHEQPKPIDLTSLQMFESRLSRLEELVNESHTRTNEQTNEQRSCT